MAKLSTAFDQEYSKIETASFKKRMAVTILIIDGASRQNTLLLWETFMMKSVFNLIVGEQELRAYQMLLFFI